MSAAKKNNPGAQLVLSSWRFGPPRSGRGAETPPPRLGDSLEQATVEIPAAYLFEEKSDFNKGNLQINDSRSS